MKSLLKILMLLIISFAATSANAQHLDFMGIPINGTIANFQSKLLNKGCSIMKNNSRIPVGIRGYDGIFAGKQAQIYVYYNPKTQIVYQARAAIDCGESKENANNMFYRYKRMLFDKYEGVSLNSDMLEEQKEFECSLMVLQPPIKEGSKLLGSINVYIVDTDAYPVEYSLIINYSDFDNSSINEKSELDDL